jgi:hypothetical protein
VIHGHSSSYHNHFPPNNFVATPEGVDDHKR